ncbi:putative sister chromatid cohesion protein DCC1 [Monocercomonoides exilis]|uniref:putative sister chromatid cohesion protein DCC1 n=1 Tax=Monocercomonoides exilis TaxID=2049356 RepID=UPI00355982BC|nr:putative sister chromatid cohesion protein DCC1 [Monocercomonoides exilis]
MAFLASQAYSLVFDPSFTEGEEKFKLLQITPSIVEQIEKEGGFYIKEDAKGEAVMCTETDTYEMKQVYHSNQSFLADSTHDEKLQSCTQDDPKKVPLFPIIGSNSSYLCLKKTAPSISNVFKLLIPTAFRGQFRKVSPDYLNDPHSSSSTTNIGKKLKRPFMPSFSSYATSKQLLEAEIDEALLITEEILLKNIGASEKEIRDEMKRLGCFELRGKVRILDEEYRYAILLMIIEMVLRQYEDKLMEEDEARGVAKTVEETGEEEELEEEFEPDFGDGDKTNEIFNNIRNAKASISIKGCIEENPEISEVGIRQTILYFSSPSESNEDERILDWEKIDVAHAIAILKQIQPFRGISLSLFLSRWRQRGACSDISVLKRKAIISDVGGDKRIFRIDISALPSDLSRRFSLIFSMKPQWSESELRLMLQDIVLPDENITSILNRYTRPLRTSSKSGITEMQYVLKET